MNTKDITDMVYYFILGIGILVLINQIIRIYLEKRMMDDFIEEVKEENKSIIKRLLGGNEDDQN